MVFILFVYVCVCVWLYLCEGGPGIHSVRDILPNLFLFSIPLYCISQFILCFAAVRVL